MNVTALKKVVSVLRDPKKKLFFDMSLWGALPMEYEGDLPSKNPSCVVCIAGAALLEAGFKLIENKIFLWPGITKREWNRYCSSDLAACEEQAARKILGLTSLQACRLFSQSSWPEPYKSAYTEIKTAVGSETVNFQLRLVGADRIEHFIRTKGKE